MQSKYASRRPMGRRSIETCARRCALLAAVSLTVVGLGVAPTAARAGSETNAVAKEAGIGLGAGLANVIYIPAKLVYAAGGLVVGSLGYVFSGGDSEVARVVMVPATAGDYVVTPAHLTRNDSLDFIGRDPRYRELDDQDQPEIAGLSNSW